MPTHSPTQRPTRFPTVPAGRETEATKRLPLPHASRPFPTRVVFDGPTDGLGLCWDGYDALSCPILHPRATSRRLLLSTRWSARPHPCWSRVDSLGER